MDCDLRELAECTICTNIRFDIRILICGHSFCFTCSTELTSSAFGIICPECRTTTSIPAVRLTRNLSVEAFIKELTNATHATFPTRLPMCRGCRKRYPPQGLKRCTDHDEFLCYMCAAFDHRACTIVALEDFTTMKLQEVSKEIKRRKGKLHALQHDHINSMQIIQDNVDKLQSDLRVVENGLSVEGNVFQPLINQFSNLLTECTEIQTDFPKTASLKCSITELEILKIELEALQIKYSQCNPIIQKLKCIVNLQAKLSKTMRAAQEKIDQSFKVLADLENVIQIGQGCPKRAFILMISAAELLGIRQRVQKLNNNWRAIRNYADTFQSSWSKYVETESYYASTVKPVEKFETSQSTKTSAHAHSVELKELAVIEGTTSNVLRKKGGEIIAYVTEVVKTCKSVDEAPEIVMNALCAANAIFPINQWLIWTFQFSGFSSTWYHIDGSFTNGSHFAISCYNILSPNAAAVVPFLERKITQYSHLNDPCEIICRDALMFFRKGRWSCIKGVTGSVFIKCNFCKQQIITIPYGNHDYVIWASD